MIQTEKLSSLGQLTAGIAQEIKNPRNFVNNFASLSSDLLEELGETLGVEPRGALRFTKYDYFPEQFVKFVVMKRSGDLNSERDHEFTDWNALGDFVDRFLATAE